MGGEGPWEGLSGPCERLSGPSSGPSSGLGISVSVLLRDNPVLLNEGGPCVGGPLIGVPCNGRVGVVLGDK